MGGPTINEIYARGGTEGVCGGVYRGVCKGVILSYHWLPLVTIDLVGDKREL